MRGVFTAEQIRTAEQAHQVELQDGTLMQRASLGLALRVIGAMRERCGGVSGRSVVILVGGGNNGGDALFAGASLAGRGARVSAVLVADRHHVAGELALRRAGGQFIGVDTSGVLADAVAAQICAADVIIDGILGIGASGAPREPVCTLLQRANDSAALRIAVDMPTGVAADTGAIPGAVFRADLTVTFAAAKPGLLIAPGKAVAGEIEVVDIGVGDALGGPRAQVLEMDDVADLLPLPGFDDYKYRRGVVGVAAGSRDYRGAGLLCVTATLSGPTGMTVLLDRGDGVADLVVSQHPEVVCIESTGSILTTSQQIGKRVTAWVCGPGIQAVQADQPVIEAILGSNLPVVLDAGALGVLAVSHELRDLLRARRAPTVLTPHDGEFTRLVSALDGGRDGGFNARLDQDRPDQDRLGAARELASELDSVILLKGPGSIIMAPDGTCFIDDAGTAALATAGSGDVLAGCIASLLACAWAHGRVDSAADAARVAAAGCWLHGMAGQRAARSGFPTASTIARELAAVTARVSRSRTPAGSWDDGDVTARGPHAR